MKEIEIKFLKLFPDSKLPEKKNVGDAGYDAYIHRFRRVDELHNELVECGMHVPFYELSRLERVACCLGFATEIPEGYYAQLVPRSGVALWQGITVINTPATIDSGYRDEWMVTVINLSNRPIILEKEQRVCQVIFREKVNCNFKIVRELSESQRGKGGFGSTGK